LKWRGRKQGGMTMREYVTQATVRASIERIELSARTFYEFTELVKKYDELDKKVQSAYGKTVWSTDSKEQFDWNAYSAKTAEKSEDILQILFSCICQMHNLIEDNDLSLLIEKATYKQKEVFFSRYIQGCSPQRIAVCFETTDRNVRDLIGKMLTNIQNGLHESLSKRRENGIYLTGRETEFLDTYKPREKPKGKKGGAKK
jgi:DNA-directed RNA polymerase specialized sigma24 family protein